MANMSYCRFRNTLQDLSDCVVALDRIVCGEESISESEWKYAKRMKEWCERFVEIIEDCDEEDINID